MKNNEGNCSGNSKGHNQNKDTDKGRLQSVCLLEPHLQGRIWHMLRLGKECPEDGKKHLRDEIASDKTKTGPWKSTRWQVAQRPYQSNIQQPPAKTVEKLSNMMAKQHETSHLKITVPFYPYSEMWWWRLWVNIVPPPVRVSCFKWHRETEGDQSLDSKGGFQGSWDIRSETFTFSRELMVPWLVLHLYVGPLA